MRCFALALVLGSLVALSPQAATAHPPFPPPGPGWYGYGPGYYRPVPFRPVPPYVVQRPVLENPAVSGLPIKITNPATNSATLSYLLNGTTYSIAPGYSQDLTQDRPWVITFSRGGSFGSGRYGLEPGLYTFTSTEHGWELYHTALPQPSVVQTPADAPPANPTPTPAGTVPAVPAPGPTH